MLRRLTAVMLIALAGALAFQAAPAAATPTCVTGAACVLTLRGRESFVIRTMAGTVAQQCDFAISLDVVDGNNAMSTRSFSVSNCTSTMNCVPGSFGPNGAWTLTLTSSRGTPYPLDVTFSTDMFIQCGIAGRIVIPGRTSCVNGVGTTRADITPGAIVTVSITCPANYVAGGMITMITGAAGTGSFTVSLSGTTDVTRDGISIS